MYLLHSFAYSFFLFISFNYIILHSFSSDHSVHAVKSFHTIPVVPSIPFIHSRHSIDPFSQLQKGIEWWCWEALWRRSQCLSVGSLRKSSPSRDVCTNLHTTSVALLHAMKLKDRSTGEWTDPYRPHPSNLVRTRGARSRECSHTRIHSSKLLGHQPCRMMDQFPFLCLCQKLCFLLANLSISRSNPQESPSGTPNSPGKWLPPRPQFLGQGLNTPWLLYMSSVSQAPPQVKRTTLEVDCWATTFFLEDPEIDTSVAGQKRQTCNLWLWLDVIGCS